MAAPTEGRGGNIIEANNLFAFYGDDNPRGAAKLDWGKVEEIRKLIDQGNSNTSIAKTYNVSEVAIRNIKLGKSWKKDQKIG